MWYLNNALDLLILEFESETLFGHAVLLCSHFKIVLCIVKKASTFKQWLKNKGQKMNDQKNPFYVFNQRHRRRYYIKKNFVYSAKEMILFLLISDIQENSPIIVSLFSCFFATCYTDCCIQEKNVLNVSDVLNCSPLKRYMLISLNVQTILVVGLFTY